MPTEEDILENIGQITDDDFGEPESELEDTGAEPEGEPEPETEPEPELEEDTTGEAAAEAPAIAPGGFGYDAKGNVIDHQGKILAKSGAERRLFEKSQILAYQGRQMQQRVDELTKLNEQLKQSSGSGQGFGQLTQQFGITPQEATMGMQLVSSFKRDPVGTVKYILTEMQAMGHNIEGLGGPEVNMGAIARMIDQRLAPITEDRRNAQREQQIEQEARRSYESFVNNPEFVHARVHEDVLARLLGQDPRLSPDAAYYKLQSWALQNGLDFTRPLKDQVTSRMQAQSRPAAPEPAPMPRGVGSAQGVTTESPYADPNASYSDIIRQAMREAGL